MPESTERPWFLRPLAGGASVLAILALAACGQVSQPSADTDQGANSEPFSYTDARGKRVHLSSTPETVVAQSSVAAALWDAGYKVDGVYGELGKVDGELNYQAGSLALDQVQVLGRTYGEFNIEKFAAMAPDLLIDFSMDNKNLWYVPPEQADEVSSIAPSIGIPGQGIPNTDAAIQSFVKLAGDLGADTQTQDLAQDKAEYEAALDKVRKAANGKENIKVLLVSRTADLLYAADPKNFPEIQTLQDAGVTFVNVHADKATGGFFEELSWEQAGKYEADVILYDAREAPDVAAKVSNIETWTTLPAVKAGQVYEWKTAAPYSYEEYAAIYRDVARWLADVKKVT